jgi:hypothetical protein
MKWLNEIIEIIKLSALQIGFQAFEWAVGSVGSVRATLPTEAYGSRRRPGG